MSEIRGVNRKRDLLWIGVGLSVFVIIAQVIGMPISLFIRHINIKILEISWVRFAISFGCMYLIALPIAMIFIKKVPIRKGNYNHRYRFIEIFKIFIISFSLAILLSLVSKIITIGLEQIKGKVVSNPIEEIVAVTSMFDIIVFMCIIGPILEEILFRKILLNRLSVYGSKVAVFVTAYAFALIHGNLSQLLYAFVLGLIFGYVALRTGGIRYTIVLHMLINFCGSALPILCGLQNPQEVNQIVASIYGFSMIVVFVLSIIFIIKDKKKLFPQLDYNKENYNVSDVDKTYQTQYDNRINYKKMDISKIILNPGMFVFLLVSIGVIVYSIVI